MSNLIYRVSNVNPSRTSSSISSDPLTSEEIDGNFKTLDDDLNLKAPLISPALTGAPTVPTAATAVNNTQAASTAYVVNRIAQDTANLADAVLTTGSYANPSWIMSIAGSKVTDAVLTTGSYANPSWITSLAETKVLPTQTSNDGKFLTTNGTSSSWAVAAITASDDTTTDATYYPALFTATSGTQTSAKVSSTKFYFNPNTGTLNSTIYNSLSDRTQKENETTIVDAVGIVKNLTGVEFTWKDTGKISSGVIAQDLELILPHLVDQNEDGLRSVNYAGLTAYLIEAIKQLSGRIAELESK